MGNFNTREKYVKVVKYVEHPDIVKKMLCTLKQEVDEQKPLIKEKVKEKTVKQGDSTIMRFSDLKDKSAIEKSIRDVFGDEVAADFLVNQASKLVKAFSNSSEMTELVRWNQTEKLVRCGNQVLGMELHYKVVITEEKFGPGIKVWKDGTKDTVVLLGYKFIQYTMDVDAGELPDPDQLKAIKF